MAGFSTSKRSKHPSMNILTAVVMHQQVVELMEFRKSENRENVSNGGGRTSGPTDKRDHSWIQRVKQV